MPNPHAPNSPWTEGRVATLRNLWAREAEDGKPLLSEAAIGRVLGMSKHQVHSKVRRLKLQPERDSPIVRKPPPVPSVRTRPPLPAGACTLPPLASLVGWEP